MRALVIFALMASAAAANANHGILTCDVVTLKDSNVFEEGLGETGTTDSDEDSQQVSAEYTWTSGSLHIGQHSFSNTDKNTQLSALETNQEITVTAQVANIQEVKLKVSKKSLKGVVLQKDSSAPKFKLVAEVDCNDYRTEKHQMLSGKATAKKVSKKSIPANVFKKISNVDVPYEMGDGYYDLKSEKFYELQSAGKVIGYLLESYLSYTEGDNVVVSTYFLANGVRFQGPN